MLYGMFAAKEGRVQGREVQDDDVSNDSQHELKVTAHVLCFPLLSLSFISGKHVK